MHAFESHTDKQNTESWSGLRTPLMIRIRLAGDNIDPFFKLTFNGKLAFACESIKDIYNLVVKLRLIFYISWTVINIFRILILLSHRFIYLLLLLCID